MTDKSPIEGLFERRLSYPDIEARERFDRLLGLDDHKSRLLKMLGILLNPASLDEWAKHHKIQSPYLLQTVIRRPPLILLAGDVGSGKTELAETVGDPVSRQEKTNITLLPLSLSARGTGRVGEMTQLIAAAFEFAASEAKKMQNKGGKASALGVA